MGEAVDFASPATLPSGLARSLEVPKLKDSPLGWLQDSRHGVIFLEWSGTRLGLVPNTMSVPGHLVSVAVRRATDSELA